VLLPLSDPFVGITRREYMKLRDVDDILAHSIGAHGTDSSLLFGVPGNTYNGGGSPDMTSARLAAIGETVERYSAAYAPIDSQSVRHGTANDLRHELDLLGAEDFALFADEQYGSPGFGYERWTDDLPLWWRQGRDAITGAPVWAPAQLIHMAGQWRNEPAIGYATSNGLACGIKEAEAALSGLFEVVERDGFMLTWYNKLSLPQIDVTSSLALQHYINRHFTPTGLDVHLVDMSAFTGIPAVLAVVRSRTSKLAPFAIGAAGAATVERACIKAATEAMYTRTWMKTEQREGRTIHDTSDLSESLRTFEDHIRLYAGTPIMAEADFLTTSRDRRHVADVPRFDDNRPDTLWDSLVGHLAQQGHRIVTFDLTSPDIRDAGAHVVKTVVTGLRPLDASYAARFMGGRRLLTHAYELGLCRQPFTVERLNQAPHPFP
jgi:ribosomal protein S12 methylthiotransferase accessory factor